MRKCTVRDGINLWAMAWRREESSQRAVQEVFAVVLDRRKARTRLDRTSPLGSAVSQKWGPSPHTPPLQTRIGSTIIAACSITSCILRSRGALRFVIISLEGVVSGRRLGSMGARNRLEHCDTNKSFDSPSSSTQLYVLPRSSLP